MEGGVVARDMRRARNPNGDRLFAVFELLAPLKVASFLSRLAAKVRQQSVARLSMSQRGWVPWRTMPLLSVRRLLFESLQLVHPMTCDYYDVCAMVLFF